MKRKQNGGVTKKPGPKTAALSKPNPDGVPTFRYHWPRPARGASPRASRGHKPQTWSTYSLYEESRNLLASAELKQPASPPSTKPRRAK